MASGPLTWLIIIASVLAILFAVASFYILVYFQHEEDKNTAWWPKAIVTSGLWLTFITILMLPFDVSNATFAGDTIPMDLVWQVVLGLDIVWVLLLIPFSIFFYEGDDPTNPHNSQCSQAVKIMILCSIVFAMVFGGAYFFLGFTQYEITVMHSGLLDPSKDVHWRTQHLPWLDQWAYQAMVSFRVSIILFVISLVAFLGQCLFVCFGGIGLTALPMDMINNWRFRPTRMTLQQYAQAKLSIGQRATTLIEIGERIQEEQRMRKRRTRKQREAYNRFKQAVFVLDEDWTMIHTAQKKRAQSLMFYWGQLLLGLFCTLLTMLWIVHIMLYFVIPGRVFGMLDDLLYSAPGSVGTPLFALLAFYLLWATQKGNFKFGLRVFVFWAVHPMRIGGTLMNSFLFNVLLLLLCAVAIAQFTTFAFEKFAAKTAASSLFGIAVPLRYIDNIFANIAIIVFAFFTFIYLLVKPTDRIKLEKSD